MTISNMGGDGGLYFNEEYLPFCWDDENLYYNIEKPTEQNPGELEIFDIN